MVCGVLAVAGFPWLAEAAGGRAAAEDPRAEAQRQYLQALPAVDRVEVVVLLGRQFQDPDAPVEEGALMPGGAKPAPSASSSSSGPAAPTTPKGFPIHPYKEFSLVRQYVSLTGADAQRVAALWRNLRVDPGLAKACHKPSHGLRFFSGKTVLLETTVSWDCRNAYVPDLGGYAWVGVDADGASGVALLKELLRVLPPQGAR